VHGSRDRVPASGAGPGTPGLAGHVGEAGVSTQYLSEVERGLKEPSSEVLGAIQGALGLRLVDLTGRVTRTLTTRPTGPVALAG